MRPCRRAAVALSALALTATLAGCGDDPDGLDDTQPGTNQPPGTEPLTPDESPSLTP